jgi:hypothetical protein
MRIVKRLVLGLTVIAALAVAATPALATAPVWQGCMSLEGGHFENEGCTKEKAGSKFEWLEITKAANGLLNGSLELEDSKTSFGAVRLSCSVKANGVVGPYSEGKIEKAALEECKVVKGTCGSPKVVAIHLPWNTELKEETGGEIRDGIKNSGMGLPGYAMTCVVIIKITDTCEGETTTKIENILTESLAEAKFEGKSEKAKCTQSGAVTGTVEGNLKIKPNEAGTGGLRAAKGPLFKITSNRDGEILAVHERAKFEIKNISNNKAKPKKFEFVSTPPNAFVAIHKAEEEACEKLNYEAGTKCSFEVEYFKSLGGGVKSRVTLLAYDENGIFANDTLVGE